MNSRNTLEYIPGSGYTETGPPDLGEIVFTHYGSVDETLGNIYAGVNEQLDYEGSIAAQRGDNLRLAGLATQSALFNTFFPRSVDEAVIGAVGGAALGKVAGAAVRYLPQAPGVAGRFFGADVGQATRTALDRFGQAFPAGSGASPRLPVPQAGMLDIGAFGPGRRGAGAFTTVNESMKPRAAAYQTQITGNPVEIGYVVDGVKFDGYAGGTLLDAKGPGYARFVRNGEFQPFFEGADDLVLQAQRQLAVARGTPIRWDFAEEEARGATDVLFQRNGISGIDLAFTPPT
jgi:hypothetical protein